MWTSCQIVRPVPKTPYEEPRNTYPRPNTVPRGTARIKLNDTSRLFGRGSNENIIVGCCSGYQEPTSMVTKPIPPNAPESCVTPLQATSSQRYPVQDGSKYPYAILGFPLARDRCTPCHLPPRRGLKYFSELFTISRDKSCSDDDSEYLYKPDSVGPSFSNDRPPC